MKATFVDFIQENHNYKQFEGSSIAEQVFDILSQDQNIIAMIEASESGKPALSACVTEVESFYDGLSSTEGFDLNSGYVKQGIGRMVRTVLKVFGYLPCGQKNMPKALCTKYITSASTYKRMGTASMKVVKTIVECQNTIVQ